MEIWFLIIFFILGTIMGSFYHVVATRLSNDESIIYPGSHCPKCNHKLKWYENIPIISYLMLKGKCSSCHSKIPISYIIVEIVTGALFSVCFHSFEFTLDLVVALIFVSSLIIVIISDIEYMIILDEVLMFASLVIVILYIVCLGWQEAATHIYGAVLSFIAMYSLKILGDKLFKKESLGGGDIKLLFLFGLVLGFSLSLCTIFLATFIAFPIAILLLFTKKDNIIPFGPFLSMAAILILVSKLDIIDILIFLVK